MENNKLKIISNLFEGYEIRSIWNADKEEYYFNITDVIKALTDSPDPSHYWRNLKYRMIKEGNETVTNCDTFKFKSKDGKMRNSDVLDTQGILDRNKLTDAWKENGIKDNYEFAVLTNEIYKAWSGMKASEYKKYKGIRKESLRDNMSDIEVALTDLGEIATRELAKEHRPLGLNENKEVAKAGREVAKTARDDLEKKLGKTIISKKNSMNYTYIEQKF